MPTIQHSFVGDEDSVIEVMNTFDNLLLLSGLKSTKAKCEIVWVGALEGVSPAPCDMASIDLTKKKKKHFRYNLFIIKNLKMKRNLSDMLVQ